MWQADTFDARRIDSELGWAAGIGMNTMRVFLHDLLWQQDAEGFTKRLDEFLAIADKHRIKPMLVLFDSVWDPDAAAGQAARAEARRAQLRLGAEPGRQGAAGSRRSSRGSKPTSRASSGRSPTTRACSRGTSGTSPTT